MPNFDDLQLMAYADGELPPADAAAITEAMAQDPALAARIERFAASRRVLKQAFALPAAAPLSPQLAKVFSASKVASSTRSIHRRRLRWPLALAASLVLGVSLVVGKALWQPAGDPLSLALETLPSGELKRTGDAEIVALSTIAASDGSLCREYERSTASATQRGLACREATNRWRERSVVAAVGSDPQPSGYQLASGEGIDAAEALKGRRLTTEEERQRLSQRWR